MSKSGHSRVITGQKQRRMWSFLVSTAGMLLILGSSALSATFYVDPVGGSDSNSGSSSSPWATIGHAKRNVNPGDTVNLRPGNYGRVTFGESGDRYGTSWNNSITFQRDPASAPYSARFSYVRFQGNRDFYIIVRGLDVFNRGDDAAIRVTHGRQIRILDCKGYGEPGGRVGPTSSVIFLTDAQHVLVEGCEAFYGAGTCRGIEMWDSHYITVRDSVVRDVPSSGIRTGGGQDYVFEYNVVHTQRVEWSDRVVHGSGFSIHSHNTVMRGNIVYNFGNTRPIRFYQLYAPGGGYRNILMENNLVYRTPDWGGTQWWVEVVDAGPNFVMRNNTFLGGTHVFFATGNDGSELSLYNNVFLGGFELNDDYYNNQNTSAYTKWQRVNEGGNLYDRLIHRGCGWQCSYTQFSPTSTSIVGGDFSVGSFFKTGARHHPYGNDYPYELAAGSRAIGFAEAAHAPERDLRKRVRDSRPDAGAYEYGGTQQNQPPVANAGSDITVETAAGSSEAEVMLDGSRSTDSDGTIVSYEWTLEGRALATGIAPTVSLGVGTHTIRLTVTDNGGLTAGDTVVVTVKQGVDTEPPQVSKIVPGPESLQIFFDEQLDKETAQNRENYRISGNSVKEARLDSSGTSVTLVTNNQQREVERLLEIEGVADSAGNVMELYSQAYVYSPDMIGFWKLNEGIGEVVRDFSGGRNEGSIVDQATWNESQRLIFGASDGRVDCGLDEKFALTGSFTLSAVINAESFGPAGWGRIIDKGDWASGYTLYVNEEINSLTLIVYGKYQADADPNMIVPGQNHHVAVVYDAQARTVRFYVDSEPAGQMTDVDAPDAEKSASLLLGNRFDLNRGFDGRISNVRIYDTAVSSDRVGDIYGSDYPFLMELIGGKYVDEGSELKFQVRPSSSDVVISLLEHNLPTQPIFADNEFSWSPQFGHAGEYEATFRATAGQFQDFETINILVNRANQKPVMEPIEDVSVYENSSVSFSVNASDGDGDELSYSASNLPGGAVFEGRTFSWKPVSGQAGEYVVTFSVSDGMDTVSQDVTITVRQDSSSAREIIIDDDDEGTSSTGIWYDSAGENPYGGRSLTTMWADATYTFETSLSGTHNISLWWTYWSSRSTAVPVEIYDGDRLLDTVYVNQQDNGGQWNAIGSYTFSGTARIRITSLGNNRSTCVDAVRFTPVEVSNGLIIDNGDAGTFSTGIWYESAGADPYGDTSLTTMWANASYTFQSSLSGTKRVCLWWTYWSSRSTAVPVEIYDGDRLLDTVHVNQQENGGQWNEIGTYTFTGEARVRIISNGGGRSTCVDAVRFTDADAQPSDVIVTNGSSRTSSTGIWYESAGSNPYSDVSLTTMWADATYSFNASVQGPQRVSMWWTYWSSRSTAVPVEIYDGDKLLDTVYVNQQENGGQWSELGRYDFSGSARIRVISEGNFRSTCVDAVRFESM